MPLIPNYIARLRTHSQSTAASASSHSGSHSNSTAGPSTPGSELARLAADPATRQPEDEGDQTPRTHAFGRKIHPDLSALVDEDAPSETEDLGPRPPRGRSLSAEQLGSVRPVDPQHAQAAEALDSQEHGHSTPNSPSPRSPLLSRILSVPLLSNVISTPRSDSDIEPNTPGTAHWSTFGRRRPLTSAINEFGSLHRRGSGSKSSAHSKSSRRRQQQTPPSVTPSITRPPSSSARTGAPSRTQTTDTTPSQPNSPVGTVSSSSRSQSHSGHSHSVRSRRQPLFHPEPIPDAESPNSLDPHTPARAPFHNPSFTPSPDPTSPLATRPTLDASPHTFGRATPKNSDSSSRPYPTIDGAFIPPSTDSPKQQQKHFKGRSPPATFPRRKHTRLIPATRSMVSFPSLPRKTSGTRLHAEDVFQEGDNRRLSANWSAAEAVRDRDEHQAETWPATVSREMVRLSLTSNRTAIGRGDVAVEELGSLTEVQVKNATRFGSTGEDRLRFMWAEQKRASAVVHAHSSSSAHLQPAFSLTPSSGPDATSNTTVEEGRLAPRVSVTAPTPTPSLSGSRFGMMSDPRSGPLQRSDNEPQSPGKRKVPDEDNEPPERPKGAPLGGSKGSSNRASDASHAPSSFRQTKRIRLSTPSHSPEHRSLSASQSPPASPSRPPSSLRTLPENPRTASQSSIPLRAIVSRRPPSIDRRSAYHMRDPTLPPSRRQSTQWAGSARKLPDEGRRPFPLQGWAFILGFLLFPIWWVAAVAPVGWGWSWRTRQNKVQDGKGVWVQEGASEAQEIWEYDVAFSWRRRCQFMSIVGLLVYTPLIVLLAVFLPRT